MFSGSHCQRAQSQIQPKTLHKDEDMEEADNCWEHVGLFWIAASFTAVAPLAGRAHVLFNLQSKGEFDYQSWQVECQGVNLQPPTRVIDQLRHADIRSIGFPNDALMNSAISLPRLRDRANYNFALLKDVFISWNADGGGK